MVVYSAQTREQDMQSRRDGEAYVSSVYYKACEGARHGEESIRDYPCILDYARETEADLIVLGRQGQRALDNVFFGNVAEKVVRKTACAVLVVPSKRQKPA